MHNMFKPTFLYIKEHNLTGLLYFGKTVKEKLNKITIRNKVFTPKWFDNEEDMRQDATLLARLRGKYAVMLNTDRGFTFILSDCNGYIYDLKALEGVRIEAVLGLNCQGIFR